MNSPEPQTDCFFLSYSRSDERVALRLATDLRGRGVAMWVDQLDIRPSERWDRAIERAVTSCRGLVAVLSPRSIASDNVMDEISYAIDSGKSVLPVMIETCTLPLRLTRMQVVDATANYDRALQQCHDELARRSEHRATAAPDKPQPQIDAVEVAKAKQQLAAALGPIAARLVDKAAARARSTGDLYGILAQHIDDDAERARFLALASTPTSGAAPVATVVPHRTCSIDPAAIETMTRLMTRYIGPIAAFVVKRESRDVDSLDDLRQRLGQHIPDERQRAEFLDEAQSR